MAPVLPAEKRVALGFHLHYHGFDLAVKKAPANQRRNGHAQPEQGGVQGNVYAFGKARDLLGVNLDTHPLEQGD